MKLSTIKAMIAKAAENGHLEIVYNGMSSGGLYSSSSCRVQVFLTRYPEYSSETSENFQDCLKSVGKKLEDFLDTIEVHDGFIEVAINHLSYVNKDSSHHTDDELNCTYKSHGYTVSCTFNRGCVASSHYSCFNTWLDKGGERFHKILIPFENIVSIVC
jgi:hypothetical protein